MIRLLLVALVLSLALALAGCGGDDEEAATAPGATSPAETQAETETAATEPEPAETEPARTEAQSEQGPGDGGAAAPSPSPEEAEGGAGDEEPARTLALFTGRGGRITPRVVRVPAFISVRVELRSGDGAEYALRFRGKTISAGGQVGSRATTLSGLRPGEAVLGEPLGSTNGVRVEATAEPGP